MDTKQFECLRCGHFTEFVVSERPRCGQCGCMTGIVDNNTKTPRFRFSRRKLETHDAVERRDH